MNTRFSPTFALVLLILSACSPTRDGPSPVPPSTQEVSATLSAHAPRLSAGDCTRLSWEVHGGFGVNLNDSPVEPIGEMEVCPKETTIYRLSVDTGLRIETREVVIIVTGPAPQAASSVQQDLVYARYEMDDVEQPLALDLYLPEVSGPAPMLIYIHGGGWVEGSKNNCPGRAFAEDGYAVACIDYRLASLSAACRAETTFPAQIHDVRAAVRWLRQNAARFGIDPERFAAIGESSGGHLAALLGTSEGDPFLEGDANLGISDAVQAVVDWFGPVDVNQPPPDLVFEDDPCASSFGELSARYGGEATPYFYWTFAWGAFLGGSLSEPAIVDRARQASPLAYVDSSDPPFLIIHGEADEMVPVEQSDLLAETLEAEGVDVTYVRVAGAGHAFSAPGDPNQVLREFLDPTLAFLSRHLGSTAESSSDVWVRTGGPPGGLGYDIRYNFDDPDTWYVTDAYAGVHISTDNGLTWLPANSGIPSQIGATGDGVPIFSLTVDPHDPEIVWAGTQNTGHIYKSVDGGQTWEQKDLGIVIQYDGLTFRGFTVDPLSSEIVYAMGETTSEAGGGPAVWGSGTGGVVYKTSDGGEQWEVIWDGGMPSSLARYMWIDPRDPRVLYVSTGLFDRGAVGEGDPETDPLGGIGILKSVDGGQTWQVQNEANGLEMLYLGSLYMHPENPDVLLASAGHTTEARLAFFEAYTRDHGDSPSGVFRTEDGGDSWTRVLSSSRVAEVFAAVEICTMDPDVAYAVSDAAVYRSQDGGRTWEQMTTGDAYWGPPGVMAGFAIDIQCDPRSPDRLFVNNYGGGNFLSEDGGRTWENASQGYTGALMRGVAVDPTDPARVYAVGRNGIWASNDGGGAWTGLSYSVPEADAALGFDRGAVAVDPTRPDHLLAGELTQTAVIESLDGGLSWHLRATRDSLGLTEVQDEITRAGKLGGMIPSSIVFAPSNSTTVYLSVSRDSCHRGHEFCTQTGIPLFTSLDGGRSWQPVPGTIPGEPEVIDVAVGPDDPSVVYAATGDGLFHSSDGGAVWEKVQGLPDGVPVRAVVVSPHDPNRILVGAERQGVYLSRDSGMSWDAIAAGLEPNSSIHDLVFDPTNPQIAYLSDLRSGVYLSTDGGSTWQKINDGLRMRATLGLAISGDGQHLYAATDGEGVYRLDLNGRPPGAGPSLPFAVSVSTQPAQPLGQGPTPSPQESPARPGPCGGALAAPLALAGVLRWKRRRPGARLPAPD